MTREVRITQQLPGWCSEEKATRLFDLVTEICGKEENPISVELGIFGGRSLTPMAFAHKLSGRGYAIGFDTWDNVAPLEGSNDPANDKWWSEVDIQDVYRKFVRFIATYDLQTHCRWLQERTDVAIELFKDETVSLLHVDSNHSEEYASREVALWFPKVKRGGIICLDDISWQSLAKVRESLIEKCEVVFENMGENSYGVYRKPLINEPIMEVRV